MRADAVRSQLSYLLRRVPFEEFLINLENGDRILIEHPENLTFATTAKSEALGHEVWILTQQLQVATTLEAVTSIGLSDSGRLED